MICLFYLFLYENARLSVLEFHDFSIAHARNRPDTADVAPLLALQAFNLRSPIERPTSSFSISRAIRRRVAGAPARSRHSSLRSHAENKIPPSAIPLGKTSGCSPSASYACKLSFLTRRTLASPRLKTPHANGCENAYALAAGIKRAFVRYGSWETKAAVKKKDDRQPTLPGWDELSYLGVG